MDMPDLTASTAGLDRHLVATATALTRAARDYAQAIENRNYPLAGGIASEAAALFDYGLSLAGAATIASGRADEPAASYKYPAEVMEQLDPIEPDDLWLGLAAKTALQRRLIATNAIRNAGPSEWGL